MSQVKAYFGDGSEWKKIQDNGSEVQIQNVDNPDWTRWETAVDWEDPDIYNPV